MKKILITANVSKEHIRKFHIPFILRLKELGWQVDVACRMDVPVPECDTAYDLPCDRNPFRGGILRSVRQLRKIIRQGGYKTVICNTVTGSMITRLAAKPLRKTGVRVIYLNHGLHFFPGASPLRWLSGYPMEKLLAPHTDVMITINATDCQTAKKYLGIPAMEQIHGIGVNLHRFTDCVLTDQERVELRQSLGLAPDDFVLTYVAEIIENKNQPMLLNALEIVRKQLPNTRLLLVGPEHDNGKLRRLATLKGLQEAVIFLGWRNDVPRLLRASDLYVASSKSEGLGLNLIEAMACELPVVAGRNRGHEEIISHGENGYLVPMNDHEQMAELILRLQEDRELADRLVAKALQDIRRYEVENVLDSLVDILRRYAHEEQTI